MFIERLLFLCSSNQIELSNVLKKLGLSTSKGTAWRNGSVPNGDILSKLAEYFGVSIDYLMGRTDDPETTHPLAGCGALSHEELQILSAYRQADDHTRELVALALKPYSESAVPTAQEDTADLLAELRRQNQEMAAEIADMKEEDATTEQIPKHISPSRSR